MPRRRPANCAGSPAFLAANGRFRTRSLRSLRHAEPDFSVRCCDTRRHRGRWMGVERWVQIATGFRTFRAETPQFRRQTGGSGRCPDFNIRQEIKPRQHNHSNWHGVSPGKSSKTGPDTKPPVRSGLHPNHLLPVRALLPTFQATVKSRSPASAQREAKPPLIFRSTSSSASAAGP